MDLSLQKRLASAVLNCSPKRVFFVEERKDEIKEAITRRDIAGLAADGAIVKVPMRGISRFRTRKCKHQKSKGLRVGPGSRKGSKNARVNPKTVWVAKIRVQREFIRMLRDKEIISKDVFKTLYAKTKGGFFRSRRNIKVFIEERQLIQKKSPSNQSNN